MRNTITGLVAILAILALGCCCTAGQPTNPDAILIELEKDPWDPPVSEVLDIAAEAGIDVTAARAVVADFAREGVASASSFAPILEVLRALQSSTVQLPPTLEAWVTLREDQLENLLERGVVRGQ